MFKSLVRATLGLGIDTFTAHLKDSNFVLGNAQATGWPIVYCSDGFCELTGYGRAQVMAKGCACRFLYGEETSEKETATIDDALENKKELKTEVLLYKKNGNPFWCLMDIVPIKNEKRQVVLFLVSHKDITKEKSDTAPDPGGPTDINDNAGGSMDKEDSESSKSDSDSDSDDMPDNYNYSRRRSRAVLYHISGQLNKQNKAKTKLQQLNRLGSQMPEYKVQEVKKSKLVIVHYGIFKIGWDWLILLCTFYIAIMVPFNAAFRQQGRDKDFIYIDPAIEVLFGIDIALNFRTSFVNKNGQVCYDSRLIALNYMRGWFLLDLLAAIPFDLLYAFQVNTVTRSHLGTLIHLLKVARLLRLARLLQKIERYSQYSVFVVAILMCMFALLAHWLACIWYAIGKQELDMNDTRSTVGWLYELSERINEPITNNSQPDTVTCYVTALYFTCSSLTSVGFGNVSANTNAEKIFSVCAMLVGAMMHAVVFGNVTAFIQRMYARRATFHAKTKDLKEFFRFHHFPKPLKTRMQEYFQTMWSVNNGIDVRDIMKDFPEDLRGEISLHLNREILSLPIFESATQGCLRSVALQTSRVFFGPGEVLIHKGDAIRNIYYVCSGSMEVLKDEQVVAILGKGDLFGSDIKFEDPVSISGGDVRSLAYCELLCINTQGLVECLQPYPEFSEKFLSEFPNDLTYNLREGHEDIEDDDTLLPAVNTLPVISEDEEEEEMSDDNDNEGGGGGAKDDDKPPPSLPHTPRTPRTPLTPLSLGRPTAMMMMTEDEESEHSEHSTTSPLLSKLTGRSNFPNGDIIGGLSPLRAGGGSGGRSGGSSGTSGAAAAGMSPSPAYLRTLSSSVGPDVRSGGSGSGGGGSGGGGIPYGGVAGVAALLLGRGGDSARARLSRTSSVASAGGGGGRQKSAEEASLMQSLQTEVEGTRSSVDKLERRMDSLCSDVRDIGATLQHILKAMGQPLPPPPPHPPLPASRPPDLRDLPPDATHQQHHQQHHFHHPHHQQQHSGVLPLPLLHSPGQEKASGISKVKTYMRDAPPQQRRVVDRQRSAAPGTCGPIRPELSPSSLLRQLAGVGVGGKGGPPMEGSGGGGGGGRPSPPTLSPLSQGLGGDERGGGVGIGGLMGEGKNQYYKHVGSDSEHDVLSINDHSSSCSPQTPRSPFARGILAAAAEVRSPSLGSERGTTRASRGNAACPCPTRPSS
ncbi:LOW QUALITY PROTEIN: voltage-gated delayed rectifier potassium channel KCNH8-like [Babylonia areolata]|uniref:LOW QUALITY PROTEIN: voltage-gated delayed rectifier potassium channel KCNH8-like n=1 Tax=Babylonia areolata TaxID=304850 RepID=UPI003FCF649E